MTPWWRAFSCSLKPCSGTDLDHYVAWRQCIGEYADVSTDDAEVELIRIFYGGRPSLEVPFLLKLSDEVQ